MVLGEPVAVLVTVTVPLTFPAVVGAKMTLNVRVCAGLSVTGVPAPVRLNPAPLSVICDIVTFALPELVTVTVCVDDDPAFTFPKPKLDVLKESSCVAAIPVPLRERVAGEFGALLTMLTLPLTVPAEAGVNCTLKFDDWPGLRESGRARVLVLNPLPATLTWLIVNVPVPLLVN